MIDFVFPNNNAQGQSPAHRSSEGTSREKEFLKLAKELGYQKLCFVYNLNDFPKTENKEKNTTRAILAKPNEVQKAKKLTNIILVEASEKNRHVIEKLPASIIFNLEQEKKRDPTHYRRSGLNQVLAKLLNKKNKAIAFNFNTILTQNKGLRARTMSRMQQNIMLARKFKVKTIIASFAQTPLEMRAPHDLIAFGITLGMHPKEAKQALKSF